jgi:hypothetical protein
VRSSCSSPPPPRDLHRLPDPLCGEARRPSSPAIMQSAAAIGLVGDAPRARSSLTLATAAAAPSPVEGSGRTSRSAGSASSPRGGPHAGLDAGGGGEESEMQGRAGRVGGGAGAGEEARGGLVKTLQLGEGLRTRARAPKLPAVEGTGKPAGRLCSTAVLDGVVATCRGGERTSGERVVEFKPTVACPRLAATSPRPAGQSRRRGMASPCSRGQGNGWVGGDGEERKGKEKSGPSCWDEGGI